MSESLLYKSRYCILVRLSNTLTSPCEFVPRHTRVTLRGALELWMPLPLGIYHLVLEVIRLRLGSQFPSAEDLKSRAVVMTGRECPSRVTWGRRGRVS